MRKEYYGWIVAALIGGVFIGSGFQAKEEKVGTVDLANVFNESNYAKSQTTKLRTMGSSREAILQFLTTYRAVSAEDAKKFRDLTVKEERTAQEALELDRVRQSAISADNQYRALQTKQNPSQAELTQLNEFNRRLETNQQTQQRWGQEFEAEVAQAQQKLRADTLSRAKDAVRATAKRQGFSIVFMEEVAPYSANDLTSEALKAMNAQK